MAGTDGRLRFHARVAANVVAMVGREIALGRRSGVRTRRLALPSRVWDPTPSWPTPSVPGISTSGPTRSTPSVRASVAAKLAVAHPGYGA